jgi:hypothetical protein
MQRKQWFIWTGFFLIMAIYLDVRFFDMSVEAEYNTNSLEMKNVVWAPMFVINKFIFNFSLTAAACCVICGFLEKSK